MTDLTTLSDLNGAELTDEKIRGIIAQIDLNIANMMRDGKLGTGKYSTAEGDVDRSSSLHALLATRSVYEKLLQDRGGWIMTQYHEEK
jgi:hypothetical protein